MTEMTNIKELINYGTKVGADEIVGEKNDSSRDETDSLKGFTPMEAELGVDYQSMS